MHQRTLIRNAIVSLLKGTGPSFATAAGENVYSNRVRGIDQVPAILVFDTNESATPMNLSGTRYNRKLTVGIRVLIEGNTDYDITLDNLTKQIEDLMISNPKLNGTASGVIYLGTDLLFDGEPKKVVGEATLTFEIQYFT